MAARRIRALCKRYVIYIRQIRVKHLELTLGYMGKFFNNRSMTMKLHIVKVLYGLESHGKDGRCGLSRNEDIRQYVGKLIEKQTLGRLLETVNGLLGARMCVRLGFNNHKNTMLCND